MLAADVLDGLPDTPEYERAREFIEKIVRGIFYVSVVLSGGAGTGVVTATCQVKDQDQSNAEAVKNVIVRSISGTLAVTLGTSKAAGVGRAWVQTTALGLFTITSTGLAGAEDVLEFTVDHGESVLIPIVY